MINRTPAQSSSLPVRPGTPSPAEFSVVGAPKAAPAPAPARDRFVPSSAGAISDAERQAIKAADSVFLDRSKSGQVKGVRHIERDARDVNAIPESALAQARSQMKANAVLEAQALGELSASDQARYKAVASAIAKSPAAGLSLQVLLLSGRLPGGANSQGDSTLKALADVASQPLAPGLNRETLLASLVQEVATPSAINQQNKGTCTVTAFSMIVAKDEPAEYVRVVGGLASPGGQVTLASGATIEREPGTDKADGTKRSVSARLWQAAMMEFGYGDGNYDNAKDIAMMPDGETRDGLFPIQLRDVISAVYGTPARYKAVNGEPPAVVAALFEDMRKTLEAGKPVLVGMEWGQNGPGGKYHGYHELAMTRIEGDRAYYLNPWGIEESMKTDDFKTHLSSAEFVSVPRWR